MGRIFLRFAVVLVVTILVVIAGQQFLVRDRNEADALTKSPVRVASVDLEVGTFLDEIEAPFRDWPEAEVEDGWTSAPVAAEDDIIGAVVIQPIPAGSPIARDDLLMPGQDGFLAAVLKPGRRAVSVAVDAVSGNAGHVFPGDRVDVILTQQLTDDRSRRAEWVSETILEAVRVIAVDQNIREDLTAREPDDVPRTFTLEVEPAEVERIAVAGQLGRLSFSLRSLLTDEHDAATTAGPGITSASDVSRVHRRAPAPEPVVVERAPVAPAQVRVLRGDDAAITVGGS